MERTVTMHLYRKVQGSVSKKSTRRLICCRYDLSFRDYQLNPIHLLEIDIKYSETIASKNENHFHA